MYNVVLGRFDTINLRFEMLLRKMLKNALRRFLKPFLWIQ